MFYLILQLSWAKQDIDECVPSADKWTSGTLQSIACIAASTVSRRQPAKLGHVRPALDILLQLSITSFHQCLPNYPNVYAAPTCASND